MSQDAIPLKNSSTVASAASGAPRAPASVSSMAPAHRSAVDEPHIGEAFLRELVQYCWQGVHWEYGVDGPRLVREPLKPKHLSAHLAGRRIGLAPIAPGEKTTRIAVLDFDDHGRKLRWSDMVATVRRVARELRAYGLEPRGFRSSGGAGVHLIMLWGEPQDAYSVRKLLEDALARCDLEPGTKGVEHGQVEVYPKQNEVPSDGVGNMFCLPLAGLSVALDARTFELRAHRFPAAATSKAVPKCERPPKVERTPVQRDVSLEQIRTALRAIPNDGEGVDYDTWRDVIFAIHHATDGDAQGLELAHEFSKRSTKYDAEFLNERVWPYVRNERGGKVITIASLFHHARKAGWEEDIASEFNDLGPAETAGAVVEPGPSGTPARASALRTANDIDAAALLLLDYLIKGWLDRGANAVLFGDWNVGKTFVALNMGVHVAAAMEWFGCRVKRAGVLYLTYEGARGIDKRVTALREQFPKLDWERLPFAWQVLRSPLTRKEGQAELQAAVKDFHERFAEAPGLVIIDPLKDALGGDDSDAELMGKLNAVVLALISKYGCAVLRLHHSGHGDKSRSRGHSSLPASADTEIRVADGIITATKQRDDGKGELTFRRVIVDLGVDQDGDRVSTCVIEPGVGTPSVMREPAGGNQKIVWRIANELVGMDSETTVGDVISAVIPKIIYDPEKKDRRRERATEALKSLQDGGWIITENGRVVIARKG